MFDNKLKKCGKQLKKLYDEKKACSKAFDDEMEKAGCSGCRYFIRETVKVFADRFNHCQDCANTEHLVKKADALDKKIAEIDSFIENAYAKEVFEFYSAKKPLLIRNSTGATETWEEAFGLEFDNVSNSLRHSLVGLVEENLRYSFK
jgi:hypothetical protein